MKMEQTNGYPEECLKLVEEAERIEFSDSVKAKMNLLIAAQILMEAYLANPEEGKSLRDEAGKLYEKYLEINRKYGRVSPKSGYKVLKQKTRNLIVNPIESDITIVQSTASTSPSREDVSLRKELGPLGAGARKSDIRLDSVCGLEELKDNIMIKIIAPLKNPEICDFYKKKGKAGILMYGPPGCGKSLVAEAIANEAGASFFNVKASDLKSKWVGETEKSMADLFAKARSKQPSIIFIDEFESLGRERSNMNNSFEKDFISQLLTEIDGLGNKDCKIVLIAATNQPWEIDSALLRSGRFGTKLYIAPPSQSARGEILGKELANRPVDSNLDIMQLAEDTAGFSGADIAELCNAATENAMKDYFSTGVAREISRDDFITAFKKVKPVTGTWLKNAARQIKEKSMEDEYGEVLECEIK